MVIQLHHTNLQQVRNLQCHIYVFYFVRVLYENLRRMLRQIRQTCVIKHKKGFAESSWEYHRIKKDILCMYPVLERWFRRTMLCVDESFSSALSYTSRPYAEAMAMRPEVTYTPYATSSKKQTGGIITFAQSEEGNLITETYNDTESSDESDSESIMMSEKDMENITTAEVMDKLDMFQSIFRKIDQFGCWNLDIIPADAGTQFTSTEFKE